MNNYREIVQNMTNKVLLHRYRVVGKVIGFGSFGVVINAINLISLERVAIKCSRSKEKIKKEYECLH